MNKPWAIECNNSYGKPYREVRRFATREERDAAFEHMVMLDTQMPAAERSNYQAVKLYVEER